MHLLFPKLIHLFPRFFLWRNQKFPFTPPSSPSPQIALIPHKNENKGQEFMLSPSSVKKTVEFSPSLSYFNIFLGILYLIQIFIIKIPSCRLYISGSVVKRQVLRYKAPLLDPVSPIQRDFKVDIICVHFWVLSLLPQQETTHKLKAKVFTFKSVFGDFTTHASS